MGKLIVLEGGDGSGKTTQYNQLLEHLKNDQVEVVKHHFPTYETPQGKLVEMYLQGDFKKDLRTLNPYFINNLYAMDRAVTFELELRDKYDKGKLLLFDRYTPSSLIYQSLYFYPDKEKILEFVNYIEDYEYNHLNLPRPDLIIYLNLSNDYAIKLMKERKNNPGVVNDIHEQDTLFQERVREIGLFLAKEKGWTIINCDDGNKMFSIEEIHEQIYNKVQDIFEKNN